MSLPALVWIDSIQVGNATAKSLLRYLATHNFASKQFYFKNSTYMRALEISEKTLQRAFAFLEEGKFITREPRFDEFGRQVSNEIVLNVPLEFYQKYEQMMEGISQNDAPPLIPRQNDAPSPVKMTSSPRQNDAPYNNNINNKSNNREAAREKHAPLLSQLSFTQQQIEEAKAKGLDLLGSYERFLSYHSKGFTQEQWNDWWKREVPTVKLKKNETVYAAIDNQSTSSQYEKDKICSIHKRPTHSCECNQGAHFLKEIMGKVGKRTHI